MKKRRAHGKSRLQTALSIYALFSFCEIAISGQVRNRVAVNVIASSAWLVLELAWHARRQPAQAFPLYSLA